MSMAPIKSISKMLTEAFEPMDYEEIAVELAINGEIRAFGAMPRNLIYSTIETAIREEGDSCAFVKTYPGVYIMRQNAKPAHLTAARACASERVRDQIGIISCYGQSWRRDRVQWKPGPEIIGCQFQESTKIDFCGQIGIYALHSENDSVEFVGDTGNSNLGDCLFEHTQGRLSGRWQRFSFYGFRPISDDGSLGQLDVASKSAASLASMRSILVEVANPRANKRCYDWFSTLEFVQWRNSEDEDTY
jgi:hypothetical protein